MKKILALAVLAGALSSCVVSVGVTTPPSISGVSVSSRFVNNANGNEFYICGNRSEEVSVATTYSGSFDSFTVTLVGELNPGVKLSYGPFYFDSATEGDTSGTAIRRLLITTKDIVPTDSDRVTPQAVIVTPKPVPPQSNAGLGSFSAEVRMTNSAGTTTVKSVGKVKVFGNNNPECP